MNAHPSELALERHLLEPAPKVRAHLDACGRCAARLEEMKRQGDEFLQYVFPATVEKVEQAAEKGARRFSWFQLFAPASAAVAALALLLMVRPVSEDACPITADGTCIKGKGGLGLSVFLNGAAGARVAREGEAVAANAAMRFRVRPSEPCHLWIVSVDSGGQVSRLFPTAGDGGAMVATQLDVPGGALLDGKSGPERVIAICTPAPMYYAAVERIVQTSMARGEPAVRGNRDIGGLPEETGQASVLLEKR